MVTMAPSEKGPRPRTLNFPTLLVVVALNSAVLLSLQQLTTSLTMGAIGGGGEATTDPSLSHPHYYGLVVPDGEAEAMPSVRTSAEEESRIDRKFYGGKGDGAHLGGFTSFDPMGVSPTLWTHMVSCCCMVLQFQGERVLTKHTHNTLSTTKLYSPRR